MTNLERIKRDQNTNQPICVCAYRSKYGRDCNLDDQVDCGECEFGSMDAVVTELLAECKDTKEGRYYPKEGDAYFFVSDHGHVAGREYTGLPLHKFRRDNHLLFRTRVEAEDYKRYLDLLAKYKRDFTDEEWSDDSISKWLIGYDHFEHKVDCFYYRDVRFQACYFETEEKAKAFIAEAGEKAVKRFMLDIWE